MFFIYFRDTTVAAAAVVILLLILFVFLSVFSRSLVSRHLWFFEFLCVSKTGWFFPIFNLKIFSELLFSRETVSCPRDLDCESKTLSFASAWPIRSEITCFFPFLFFSHNRWSTRLEQDRKSPIWIFKFLLNFRVGSPSIFVTRRGVFADGSKILVSKAEKLSERHNYELRVYRNLNKKKNRNAEK